jgi:hypothetical protein
MSARGVLWSDDPPFPENAAAAVGNAQLRRNIRQATTTIRERRARRVAASRRSRYRWPSGGHGG